MTEFARFLSLATAAAANAKYWNYKTLAEDEEFESLEAFYWNCANVWAEYYLNYREEYVNG